MLTDMSQYYKIIQPSNFFGTISEAETEEKNLNTLKDVFPPRKSN